MMHTEISIEEPEYRHEKKYICPLEYMEVMRFRISNILSYDSHVNAQGKYFIKSLYFDSYNDSCLYQNEAGEDPRQKWRIRTYNHDKAHIALELKEKKNGLIRKETCLLSYEQYLDAFRAKLRPNSENAPLLNKFVLEQMMKGLKPKVIVQYERVPFILERDKIRITFDFNIFSCPVEHAGALFSETVIKRPILRNGIWLLEVKYGKGMPEYVRHLLHMREMSEVNFSKYYLCRKYSMTGGMY